MQDQANKTQYYIDYRPNSKNNNIAVYHFVRQFALEMILTASQQDSITYTGGRNVWGTGDFWLETSVIIKISTHP